MPRYTYKCLECSAVFIAQHPASERRNDCDACDVPGTLRKVPSMIKTEKKQGDESNPVGSLVKDHIETTKEEIALLKERLKGSIIENE